MKSISTLAIAIGLMSGGAILATPAIAQDKGEAAAAQWKPKISKAEATALKSVETAIAAQDWAAATAAITAAQGAVSSADARYYLGQYQLQIGGKTNNPQLQAQGIDAMIASGGGDPTKMALLYKNQGALAAAAKDYAKAETAFTQWAKLAPNDPEAMIGSAEIKFRQKKPQEAFPLFQKAIAARQALGEPVPEGWYSLALQSALDAKMGPQAVALSRGLISTNPNPTNWRNGLLIYRQSAELDPTTRLDTLRLMRATKALDKGDEFLSLADLLDRGNFYSEAKAVIDEGRAAGKIQASNANATTILQRVSGKIAEDRAALAGLEARARSGANGELALRLADGYYGHNDYAKAAEFYRLALQKGSVDANLANTRLGMALALSGKRTEAETALKAVSGPRAELASYWLLWLSQRSA